MVSFRGQTSNKTWAKLRLGCFISDCHPCIVSFIWWYPPPTCTSRRSKALQEKLKRWDTPLTATSPHLMESGFRNEGNFCLWNTESGKSLLSSCGIWNTAQGIRNLTNDCNPESTFHWQRPQSTTWNLESTAWNPESKTALDSLTLGELW